MTKLEQLQDGIIIFTLYGAPWEFHTKCNDLKIDVIKEKDEWHIKYSIYTLSDDNIGDFIIENKSEDVITYISIRWNGDGWCVKSSNIKKVFMKNESLTY